MGTLDSLANKMKLCNFEAKAMSEFKKSPQDYPINVARNIARESANTHFVFPADIELYPSPGLIPDFLEMIRRNDQVIKVRENRSGHLV